MSEFRKRLFRRSLIVVSILAVMGYLFGQVFLMFTSYYAGTSNSDNDRVLWQTPLTMAGFGLVLTILMELISFALSKKAVPAKISPGPSTEELLSQLLENGGNPPDRK